MVCWEQPRDTANFHYVYWDLKNCNQRLELYTNIIPQVYRKLYIVLQVTCDNKYRLLI